MRLNLIALAASISFAGLAGAATGSITATKAELTNVLGTTTITWTTTGAPGAVVYVSGNGAAEQLMAASPSGTATPTWIQANRTFDFSLYSDSTKAELLGKVRVYTPVLNNSIESNHIKEVSISKVTGLKEDLCALYIATNSPLPEYCSKTVFVSSSVHTGNLGGPDGADAICNNLAANAGLTGKFKAWLSNPSARFTHSPYPYKDVVGANVALNWSDLTDGTLGWGIWHDEQGNYVGTWTNEKDMGEEVWTGTAPDGTPTGTSDCNNWTDANPWGTSDTALGMTIADDLRWTGPQTMEFCGAQHHIYCFEQ